MSRRALNLWRCPRCGEAFTTRNQWHSCGRFALEPLFAMKAPHVRALYDRFVEVVRECGPVTVIPQRTRFVREAYRVGRQEHARGREGALK